MNKLMIGIPITSSHSLHEFFIMFRYNQIKARQILGSANFEAK